VARGLSSYIDKLIGNVMQNKMRELMPIDIDFLSTYPDFLSLVVIMVLAGKFWNFTVLEQRIPLITFHV
jgi:hypothetical protein